MTPYDVALVILAGFFGLAVLVALVMGEEW